MVCVMWIDDSRRTKLSALSHDISTIRVLYEFQHPSMHIYCIVYNNMGLTSIILFGFGFKQPQRGSKVYTHKHTWQRLSRVTCQCHRTATATKLLSQMHHTSIAPPVNDNNSAKYIGTNSSFSDKMNICRNIIY